MKVLESLFVFLLIYFSKVSGSSIVAAIESLIDEFFRFQSNRLDIIGFSDKHGFAENIFHRISRLRNSELSGRSFRVKPTPRKPLYINASSILIFDSVDNFDK